jgi:hypothetical protein
VLTLGDDHQTQEAAWDSLSHYDRSAYHLREVLLNGELKATSRLASFVGVEAYEAAGGKTRLDLFADEGNGVYLLDTDLLHSLAKAKLQEWRTSCRRRAGLGSNAASNRIRASTATLAGRRRAAGC